MFLKADLSPRMHLLPGAAVANCHKFGDSLSSRRPGDQNRDSGRSASRAAASGGSGGGSSSASSSSWGLRPLPRRRGALSSVSAVPREAPGRGTESTIRDEPAFPLGVPESGSTCDSARVGDVQGVGLTHGYSAERPAPGTLHSCRFFCGLRTFTSYSLSDFQAFGTVLRTTVARL